MELRHDVAGSGPTLVLVHGVVDRRQAWRAVLDQLTPYRRVVTVDLPGHGESAALAEGPDVLGQLLVELGDFVRSVTPSGERPHIAGNSLGGWLTLALAARGEVASATALSPAGFYVSRADQVRTVLVFRALRELTRAVGPMMPKAMRYKAIRYPSLAAFYGRPSRVPYEDAVIGARSLATNALLDRGMTASFDFPPVVDTSVPVTVVWGRRDMIHPVYEARRVRKVFPQARVLVLPGIGHVPMTDDPTLISTILLGGSSAPSQKWAP
ncbi:alpha/beta fold hydrolase [Prescottella agglutinans]|uniref:Pimeloyl-ACP methyl ester carboxylesterase n=1 Tax=Prescottella agglutinans TaxID=1644129 RepID=A0ABT6MG13_9NOCA|nr:alpha/beta fold hydrolase [Prescottella agglutinans]MDH6283258.1 pimeloyl-ACP methyl ester carboxylesterase [Prescottella agglutinans]